MSRYLRFPIFLLFTLLITYISLAQENRIKSYKEKLSATDDNFKKVELLFLISWDYGYLNIDSAYHYAFESFYLAKEIDFGLGIAAGYDRIGQVKQIEGKYEEALVWLDSSVSLNKERGDIDNELGSINNKATVYNAMGDLDTGLQMNIAGLNIAKKNRLYDRAGSFSANIGLTYLKRSLYDTARYYFHESIENLKLSNNAAHQSIVLDNIGTTYYSQSDYPNAFLYYQQALELADSVDYQRTVNSARSNLALVYRILDSPEKALEYLLPIIESYKNSGLSLQQSNALANAAKMYKRLDRLDEAIAYAKEAIAIQEPIDAYMLSESYLVLGKCLYDIKDYKEGLDFVRKALKHAKARDYKTGEIKSSLALAEILIDEKQFREAINMLSGLQRILENLEETEDYRNESNVLFSKAYKGLGQTNQALSFLERAYEYDDKLKEKERTIALAKNAIEYETDKKEQELIQLKQQAEIRDLQLKERTFYIILLVIGFVILVLSAVVVVLFARQKRQQLLSNNQSMEQKLLRVQLNPHFIFNALNSIQEYVFMADTKSASKFLASFSRLMRQTLENSRREFVSLSEEIEMLEDYLALQSLRKSFKYKVTYEDSLDVDNVMIPSMFAQPFVENAVEHGISENVDDPEITIHFALSNDIVSLTIQDNGIGLTASFKTNSTGHKSLATRITEERILLLKKLLQKSIVFKIEELKRGTKVMFHLPYQVQTMPYPEKQ